MSKLVQFKVPATEGTVAASTANANSAVTYAVGYIRSLLAGSVPPLDDPSFDADADGVCMGIIFSFAFAVANDTSANSSDFF